MDIDKKIEVMKAYSEGKQIESRATTGIKDWEECSAPTWNFEDNEYRIKPKQIRAYTPKELIEAIKIHGLIIKSHEEGYEDGYYTIVFFSGEDIGIVNAYDEEINYYSYDNYTSEAWSWADDNSPIGVIEEYSIYYK